MLKTLLVGNCINMECYLRIVCEQSLQRTYKRRVVEVEQIMGGGGPLYKLMYQLLPLDAEVSYFGSPGAHYQNPKRLSDNTKEVLKILVLRYLHFYSVFDFIYFKNIFSLFSSSFIFSTFL